MQFNVKDLKDVENYEFLVWNIKSVHLHICCKDIGIRNLSLWQRHRIPFQINYTNAGKELAFVTFPLYCHDFVFF